MHYVINTLAAILIGIAFGAVLGPRNTILYISSVIAIVLGAVAIYTSSWLFLAIGTAIYLLAQSLQRDPIPTPARA